MRRPNQPLCLLPLVECFDLTLCFDFADCLETWPELCLTDFPDFPDLTDLPDFALLCLDVAALVALARVPFLEDNDFA